MSTGRPEEKEAPITPSFQWGNKTRILNLFKKLSQQPKEPLTPGIRKNIDKIKQICRDKYYDQSFYGNAALNRRMLLDKDIAELLTPEVIRFLFTNPLALNEEIPRNSSNVTQLREALFYGFSDGLDAIRLMPNNEPDYSPARYKKQQKDFLENTLTICESLKEACGLTEIPENVDARDLDADLLKQFEEIVLEINRLKKTGQSSLLLVVPGYTPSQIRSQVGSGFSSLLESLRLNSWTLAQETLDSFCEQFLKNPHAILNGHVIHLFYDRAHLEAALEQDTFITIGKKKYKYEDILRKMIEKISAHPDHYPPCAKEQF